jgi:Na+/H+-dicarboxylate symporter
MILSLSVFSTSSSSATLPIVANAATEALTKAVKLSFSAIVSLMGQRLI